MGFAGKQVQLVSSIKLPVITREYSRQRTIMVKFLLVNRPSTYNAILGRMALNVLRAVTSTSHLNMKFPIEQRVGEMKGDQLVARQCYNIKLKDAIEKTNSGLKGEEK